HFFFQAEDGIRDFHVTGVQTCALPISATGTRPATRTRCAGAARVRARPCRRPLQAPAPVAPAAAGSAPAPQAPVPPALRPVPARSEERRVGKECRARWAAHRER